MRTFLLSLLLIPTLAMAEVSLTTEAFKIVPVAQADGSVVEEWRPADQDQIIPGDKIGFRISYSNNGTEAAEQVVINNPIPAQASYIANSAMGINTAITYSVDGGKAFDTASQLVVNKDGASRPAKAEDYTNVRWQLTQPVEAGASGKVEYKVRIN